VGLEAPGHGGAVYELRYDLLFFFFNLAQQLLDSVSERTNRLCQECFAVI
jgi:hypothetical protein